jgi:hypothetical protein
MLGGLARRTRGWLSSRWGPAAALACWGALAGFVFLVWLAPPAAPRRPLPAATADGPVGAPPRDIAAPPPSAGNGQDAAVEAAASAAPAAAVRLQPTMISLARAACAGAGAATSAGCASDAEPAARGGRPGAAQASAADAPAAVLIRHRGGSAAGREAAQRIADEARRAGVEVVGIRAASSVPKKREVRYLPGGDAAEGERLASRFRSRWGNDWEVRESEAKTASSVKAAARPAPAHTLEVWLPHR